ncbi:MAG: 3-dehydroquinate synthase [Alistipes sp.]|nr:3-dehydroquinate synthase [Alistipes sp.]
MGEVANSRVYIGSVEQLLPQLLPKCRVIVITDSNIDRCHHALISSYEHIIIGLGEQAKNLTTLEKVYTQLMDMGADRSTFLLGIGGGIVTDITGFVGATYMRGVDFGFIPTTLLAMVDASVGGKNGVNIGGFKNMVGTFLQPNFVICDAAKLSTLSDREFAAGLAEVIKAAVIADAQLFELLESSDFDTLRTDGELLSRVVEAALQVKIDVVAADERERGLRRVLNLGHTIAHAIEKSTRVYNHGEAVAVGLCCVAEVAERLEKLSKADTLRIKDLCVRYNLPTELPEPITKLLKAIRKDKKREGDNLHLILPTAIGAVEDLSLSFDEVENVFKKRDMIKGLIFDMDGTLIQNMPYHMKAFNVLAERLGYQMLQPVTNKFYGRHNDEIFSAIAPQWIIDKYGLQYLSDEKEAIYRELYAGNVRLTDGLAELIADAKSKGVKCYIGSAGPRVNLELIWNGAELDDKIDGYICGDDIVNFKPHPEVFLKSCEAMGVSPEECVVFEDAISGIKAGWAAGCKVVALSTTATVEALAADGVEHIVPNFEGMTIASLEEMLYK